ncbi:RHS repeat-associated core domain-containing protein [Acinetobacter baumannii]|uniref:RHS repeat-associated core domain-containing protein n=1 Tax=Acinetobacter baumannii TaxID=470 RepID=UPI003AF8D9ED
MGKIFFKSNILNFLYTFFIFILSGSFCCSAEMFVADNNSYISYDKNIKSCTVGYNLLSGQISYKKNLVSGALPYTLSYRKATRYQILDQEDAIGADSWSDNYDGFVNVYYGTYFTAGAHLSVPITNYVIKLPNDSHRYYFKEGPTNFNEVGYPEPYVNEINRGLYRIYTTSEPPASGLPGRGAYSGYGSTDYGEIKFTVGSNSMTVIRNGITYSATISKSINRELLFRFTKITYPDGKTINLSYDSNLNLTTITDNKNNKLTLTRNGSQVSSVLFSGGTLGDTQQYDLTYSSVLAGSTSYPQLSQIKNTKTGVKENYTYGSALSLPHYEAAITNNIANPDVTAQRPILSTVIDNLNQVKQTWKVEYPSYTYDPLYKQLTAVKVILRSFLGAENGNTSFNTSTTYEDGYSNSKISLDFQLATNQVANSVINTTSSDYSKTNVDASGFPCLTTADNRPIKSIIYAPADIRPMQITDQNSNVTTYAYDNLNRILEIIEASGSTLSRKTTYIYGTLSNGVTNPFNIPVKIQRGNLTTDNVINDKGQITQQSLSSTQTGSTTKVTTYTYYSDSSKPNNGLLSSEDGPRSGTADKINYTYDNYGNLSGVSSVVNGATRTTQYIGYNSFGQPERIVYPNGMVQKYNYNTDGTLSSVVLGSGSTSGVVTGLNTTYTYDTLGQLIKIVNPNGQVTSYNYDNMGRLIKINNPDGSVNTKTYFNNNVVSSDELRDSILTTIYKGIYRTLDINGRVAKLQIGSDTTSNWRTLNYDANGNIVQIKTASGISESWSYDALNRMTSHTDGTNNIDTKTYDSLDNTITAIDAVASGTDLYTYRNSSILTKEINKDYGTKSYTYNEADQLTQSLYGNRKCDYSNIDEVGRNKTVLCQNSTSNTSDMLSYDDTYTFDSSRFGRLDKITSNKSYGVDSSYGYDLYDRVTSKSQSNKALTAWGASASALSTGYTWSNGDKLTSLSLPSGRKLTYNYDSTLKGQITGINLDGSAVISNVNYDAAGQMTGWTWGSNAGSYIWTYNTSKNGVIKQIINKSSTGATTYSLNYGFDKDGRITSISRNNNLNDTYSYDNANRLVTESRANGSTTVYSIAYTYDKNGNRLTLRASGSHLQPAATVNYGYTGNKLTSLTKNGAAQSVNYTANAELYIGSTVPSYDYAGRRRGEGTSTTINRYMSYNANNERTLTSLASGWVNNTSQFIYDEQNHLVGEYTSSGSPIVEYVWIGDKPIAAIYGSGSATKIYYIVTDIQNTPRRLVDTSGNVAWSWDSTAFGLGNPTGNITFNLRFPGQYFDATTGQFYNHRRFYSPELGRYMEPDPIGLVGGLNPYTYALSNPIMYVDMTGENPVMLIGAIVGGVIGGGVNILGQVASMHANQSNSFNWKALGVATLGGAITGALAPLATTGIAAAGLGSLSGMGQYAAGQYVDNMPITTTGVISSGIIGMVTGGLSKGLSTRDLKYPTDTSGLYIPQAEALRVNNNKLVNQMYNDKELLRSAVISFFGEGSAQATRYIEQRNNNNLLGSVRDYQWAEFYASNLRWTISAIYPDGTSISWSCTRNCVLPN